MKPIDDFIKEYGITEEVTVSEDDCEAESQEIEV